MKIHQILKHLLHNKGNSQQNKKATAKWEKKKFASYISVQFSSVAQSCPTLCDPMDCSTPGLPIHHQLPELAQTHVHQVNDASQPPHPLIRFSTCLQSFPASGSFPMSQFFTSDDQTQLQHQSFQ